MTWDELQDRAFTDILAALEGDERRLCFYGPTGFGKTRIMIRLIEWATNNSWDVHLYTNRRLLCAQIKGVLESHGISPGMRAAGYEPALLRPVQLCMTQTVGARDYQHDADLVLIDEAHIQKGETMRSILDRYREQDGTAIGFTGTPLDLDFYDKLILGATLSECFDCGALVEAEHFAPDEPNLSNIRKYQIGVDLSEADNRKAIMRPGIEGRVFSHWKKLNPHAEPTIGFGPDVGGSLYFAEEFYRRGVRSAHIDGSNVWLDGEWIGHNNEDAREHVLDLVRSGHVPIVWNRYVLREGIDVPEFKHGILATVFGSLSSYIQSCGRLLRACDGKTSAVIQDHGGNWHRHGSINADREWGLYLTNHRAVSERHERLRQRKELEPVVCPECGLARFPGPKPCPRCGHIATKYTRVVVQSDGTLKEYSGRIYRERIVKEKADTAKRWERYYWGQKRAGRTFNQAYAWFFHEEGYWPPKNLPLMPINPGDWYSKIADVPMDQLYPRKEAARTNQNYSP